MQRINNYFRSKSSIFFKVDFLLVTGSYTHQPEETPQLKTGESPLQITISAQFAAIDRSSSPRGVSPLKAIMNK
jgi:hypothetical protein